MQKVNKIDKKELDLRMSKYKHKMDSTYPDWQLAVITSEMNQYYFTGTIQQGMLIIRREGKSILWVRKSLERALLESEFEFIYEMSSFRVAIEEYDHLPDTIYLEKNDISIHWYEMFSKYFKVKNSIGIDRILQMVRAVKTDFEIDLHIKAGNIHRILLEYKIPNLIKEGMTEIELIGEIYLEALKMGHHGISRFSGFNGDMFFGYVAFSENGLFPTNFDGPGGTIGLSPSTPLLGSSQRKLKKGDIVFVDFGVGVDGYSTDKTQLYSFGTKAPKDVADVYDKCRDIMYLTAEKLRLNAIPSKIYQEIINSLPEEFKAGFMGYKDRTVKFLGHGIGLHIDEYPVIANGFDEPLQANMTIALEPKKGVDGYGIIGVEETFLIKNDSTFCLTSKNAHFIDLI